jgi:D-arabinose 1-dehydrogenase-like Zn-dependent alcohol dehydrogenase
VATDSEDPAKVLRAWDGGADLIVNGAPSTAAATAAFGGLAPDGTLVLLGYHPGEPLTLPTMPMVLGRLHAMANPSGSPHDLRNTLAFAAAHRILPDVTPITLDEAPETLAAMAAGTARGPRHVITF